jgi:hypothetical protein
VEDLGFGGVRAFDNVLVCLVDIIVIEWRDRVAIVSLQEDEEEVDEEDRAVATQMSHVRPTYRERSSVFRLAD